MTAIGFEMIYGKCIM